MSEEVDYNKILIIETPDNTTATYVYTDEVGNRVFHDGLAYWCIENGEILYYD